MRLHAARANKAGLSTFCNAGRVSATRWAPARRAQDLATRVRTLLLLQVARPSNAVPEPEPAASSEQIIRADQPPAAADSAAAGTAAAADTASWTPADAAASGSVPSAPAVAGSGGAGGVQGPAGGGSSGSSGGGGQSAVALLTRFNGVGYTFVLAGFLKIVTIGGLAASAPVDTARTALGKASPYLLVPGGLALAWLAKQAVDSGLTESKRFLQIMVGALLLLYFGLTKLLFKYQPDSEWVRRPRPRLPGALAELRAGAGDKDLLAGAGSVADSRSYGLEKPGRELYDDVAWYEGRYPSQLSAAAAGAGAGGRRQAAERAYRSSRAAAAAASDTEEEYAAAVEDILRSRGPAAGLDDGRPKAAPARRSYLSDNQR